MPPCEANTLNLWSLILQDLKEIHERCHIFLWNKLIFYISIALENKEGLEPEPKTQRTDH